MNENIKCGSNTEIVEFLLERIKEVFKLSEKISSQTIDEIQENVIDDFDKGNGLLKIRILLSKKTGFTQKEIGELSMLRFANLFLYHDLHNELNK